MCLLTCYGHHAYTSVNSFCQTPPSEITEWNFSTITLLQFWSPFLKCGAQKLPIFWWFDDDKQLKRNYLRNEAISKRKRWVNYEYVRHVSLKLGELWFTHKRIFEPPSYLLHCLRVHTKVQTLPYVRKWVRFENER